LLLAGVAAPSAWGEDIPYQWNGVSRIVAVGDVHGAYDNLVAVLQNAGLVDQKLRWVGGRTHLVQLGDVLDRGARSRDCLELLMRLEREAERAGGRVHALIGNHEAFNVLGLLDYVSPGEFASYVDDSSRSRWESALRAFQEGERRRAQAASGLAPSDEELRQRFKARYPLGYFEHREAFGREGRYGRWIRRHNTLVRLNGIVFSHADWSEAASGLGPAAINEAVRAELSGKEPLEGGIILDVEGPLQYRGLARVPLLGERQAGLAERVERILANLGATRLVVAHTVTGGFVESRFGGRHLAIDTGMLAIYGGGHQVALEIEGAHVRALHPLGKVDVPADINPQSLAQYLEAVAAVDPENRTVSARLAALERGDTPVRVEKALQR
jgi:hypothetical protein